MPAQDGDFSPVSEPSGTTLSPINWRKHYKKKKAKKQRWMMELKETKEMKAPPIIIQQPTNLVNDPLGLSNMKAAPTAPPSFLKMT